MFRLLLTFACLVGLLILSIPRLAGHLWRNVGFWRLNVGEAGADIAFDRALTLNPSDTAARWGVGWLAFEAQDRPAALDAWQNNPLAVERVGRWAELAQTEQDMQGAQVWYQWLLEIHPAPSEVWYAIGRLQQRQEAWDEALAAYEQALVTDRFQTPLLSHVYYQRGDIYQWRLDQTDWIRALQQYQLAIQADQFSDERLAADTWYKMGEIYDRQGRNSLQQLTLYRRALAYNPEHMWAQLRYGYAHYWVFGEVETAEALLQPVITRWTADNSPYLKWPYRYLGDIYRDAQRWAEAQRAYEQVRHLDPQDEHALAMLAALDER